MNKLIMILCLAVSLQAVAGESSQPAAFNVTTSSVMILPPRNVGEGFQETDATTFANSTAVTQGQIIKYTGGYWWVVTAGTTGTVAPTNTIGDFTSNTAVLRRIPIGRRKGVAIVNLASTNTFLSVGSVAESGKGIALTTVGSSLIDSGVGVPQTAIYAITATGTNAITVCEW